MVSFYLGKMVKNNKDTSVKVIAGVARSKYDTIIFTGIIDFY